MSIMEKVEGHKASKLTASPLEFLSPEEPTLNPLVLLLQVETLDGNSLPDRFLTVLNCRDLSIKCGEEEPYRVELLSVYEACLTFKENAIIVDLAIKLMAIKTWIGVPVVITAVILSWDKVDQIMLAREKGRKEKEV